MDEELTPEEQAEQRKALYESVGLKYEATFQPRPQPKATVSSPTLNWIITLTTPKGTMQCPYSQGVAHVQGYKQPPWGGRTLHDVEREDRYRKTCETGKLYRDSDTFGDLTAGTQPAPAIDDVLYCLVSDASVMDCRGFEEWVADYGYDTDSRKAEAIYRDCLEQSKNLYRVLGQESVKALEQLFMGY